VKLPVRDESGDDVGAQENKTQKQKAKRMLPGQKKTTKQEKEKEKTWAGILPVRWA
jgi:hypothetical protein